MGSGGVGTREDVRRGSNLQRAHCSTPHDQSCCRRDVSRFLYPLSLLLFRGSPADDPCVEDSSRANPNSGLHIRLPAVSRGRHNFGVDQDSSTDPCLRRTLNINERIIGVAAIGCEGEEEDGTGTV